MTLLRNALLWVSAALLLVALLLGSRIDSDTWRTRLQAAVAANGALTLRVDGAVAVAWWPTLRVRADNAVLTTADTEHARFDRLEADLSWAALLGASADVARITLIGGDVRLPDAGFDWVTTLRETPAFERLSWRDLRVQWPRAGRAASTWHTAGELVEPDGTPKRYRLRASATAPNGGAPLALDAEIDARASGVLVANSVELRLGDGMRLATPEIRLHLDTRKLRAPELRLAYREVAGFGDLEGRLGADAARAAALRQPRRSAVRRYSKSSPRGAAARGHRPGGSQR